MQNHTGSKPAAVTSGVKIGRKISTIEIQSRKKPAMNRMNSIIPSSAHGDRSRCVIIELARLMPPPPMNTPVNSVPPSSTNMIIAVTRSVFSSDS